MADVQINTKQLEAFRKRLIKAASAKNNPVQKQQRAVLNKINAERVKNVRRAVKPFSYTGRLAKSVKKKSAWVSKKDGRIVYGRLYYGYQSYFGGELRTVKRGRYNKKGRLIYSASAAKGEYYAHIPEYGRRNGEYKGRHFLWDSEKGVNDIAEYKKALYKAVDDVLIY